jgi:uncharacterized protein (TIGR02265 family)
MALPPDPLIFHDTFEGLWVRGLKNHVSPELREAMLAEGVDVAKLLPAYPLATWKRCMILTVSILYPLEKPDVAYARLGRLFMDGFFETFIGRAMLPLLKLLGTKRVLERLRHSFRQGNNFSDTRLELLGPGKAQVWINEVFGHPSFVSGFIVRAMELIGDPSFEMKLVSTDGVSATYDATWKA